MKKIKLVRTYGPLPTLTKKLTTRTTAPGQHGQSNQRNKKQSQYGIRLAEKQKVRHNYALSERQFVKYVEEAKRSCKQLFQLRNTFHKRQDELKYPDFQCRHPFPAIQVSRYRL